MKIIQKVMLTIHAISINNHTQTDQALYQTHEKYYNGYNKLAKWIKCEDNSRKKSERRYLVEKMFYSINEYIEETTYNLNIIQKWM